jgi:hypothetical protein
MPTENADREDAVRLRGLIGYEYDVIVEKPRN